MFLLSNYVGYVFINFDDVPFLWYLFQVVLITLFNKHYMYLQSVYRLKKLNDSRSFFHLFFFCLSGENLVVSVCVRQISFYFPVELS